MITQKTKATSIRLRQSILGWILSPVSEDSKEALDLLYCGDYYKMSNGGRAFMRGKPVENALAHVRDVCKSARVGMSTCGNPNSPTIRLWLPKPPPVVKPTLLSVDLKWSAWSDSQSIWEDYAPGVWGQMRMAWQGITSPVMVSTAPRKEIRYGGVTISKGRADGYFRTEWDDPEDLAHTLGVVFDDGFKDSLPYSTDGESVGIDRDFSVRARSFEKLMRRIDSEESNLLQADGEHWKLFEQLYRFASVS